MTTNMRNAIEQAAYEIGVATAKYELLIGHSAMPNALVEPTFSPVMPSGTSNRKRGRVAKVATKAIEALQELKAPVVARGVKKSRGPRAKGVKDAIMNLVSEGENSTADIIHKTGLKATSINSTLMKLKKDGIAIQDSSKRWVLMKHDDVNGNSESANIHTDY